MAENREDHTGDDDDEAREQGDGGHDEETPKDGKEKPRRRWPLVVLAVVVIVLVIAAIWYYLATRNQESTDDAFTDGRAITIAPQIAGNVVALEVNDNQFVHKGQVLIRIDPRSYIAANDQAKGAAAVAAGQLAGAQLGHDIAAVNFPARLSAAQAQVAIAHAAQFKAATDYRRQHNIERAATSQETIDASTAALRQADAQVAAAEAQLREATPVKPSIDQVQAQVQQLQGTVEESKAELEKTELNLSFATVVAPQDGYVTRRNVETGDYVQPGQQIMTIVSPQIWVTANFKETQLARMRPGQAVDISVDAYPDLALHGHVDSVQMGTGSRFSTFPAENATGNFVKIVQRVPVKIDIDSGLDPNRPLPLGLSVDPTVHFK